MILLARFNPLPDPIAAFTLPEPRIAFEMIHHKIGCSKGIAAMARRCRHQHDRIARQHLPGAVQDQQPIQLPAVLCQLAQRNHPWQGQRPEVPQFQHFDPPMPIGFAANLTEKADNPARLRIARSKLIELRPWIERTFEKSDVWQNLAPADRRQEGQFVAACQNDPATFGNKRAIERDADPLFEQDHRQCRIKRGQHRFQRAGCHFNHRTTRQILQPAQK